MSFLLPDNERLADLLRRLAHTSLTFERTENGLALIHDACGSAVRSVVHADQLDPVQRDVLDHLADCPAAALAAGGDPSHLQLPETEVVYDTPSGPTTRPIRAFLTGPRHVTCFVTEHGAGMSITNAAEQVHAALRTLWHPDTAIRVIEHYPADSISPTHYDEVFRLPSGVVAWRRLLVAALIVEFEDRLPY